MAGARVALTTRGDRLLDIIATAGGIRVPANETFLELSRGGKTVRVPFQTLLNTPRENIFARPGDTLTVVRYPLSFTAVGATGENAVVSFTAVGISLEEAIGKASGLIDSRADPEGVFLLRYEPVAVVRDYPGLTPAQAALDLVPTVYLINMARSGIVVPGASIRDARQGHRLRLEFALHRHPESVGHHPDRRLPADQRRIGRDHPSLTSGETRIRPGPMP